MENLNFILFISIVTPLCMMLFVCKDKVRSFVIFFIIGVTICLLCGEINGLILRKTNFSEAYFYCNVTVAVEELFKAIPILFFAFVGKPKRQQLLEASVAVGVGFAVQENAYILAGSVGELSIFLAIIRGLGCGMLHGVCCLAVGYGISFAQTKRKLFVTGTIALLAAAMVYHSLYNQYTKFLNMNWVFLMPGLTFAALLFIIKRHKKV